MGLLTTPDSARAFSSYVTGFGLALFISSVIYLKRINSWKDQWDCRHDDVFVVSNTTTLLFPLCSQVSLWRAAAIVGIVIGIIDTLIVPILLCCGYCAACGCLVCIAIGCPGVLSDDSPKTPSDLRSSGDNEATAINVEREGPTAGTENLEPEGPSKPANKYDLKENVPSKFHIWLDALGWILWVLSPFLATLFVTISLYSTDAIRTRYDELYNPALALFIFGLFNLMVYFQKFMNSVCGYGHKKVSKTTE